MTVYLLTETICSSMALAISVMAICLLVLRHDPNGIYRPLILFFSANALVELVLVLSIFTEFGYFESLALNAEILSIPAFLLLAPALWLYVRGLTSETQIHISLRDFGHFIPFMIAVLACSLLLFSPSSTRNQIIGDGDGTSTLWIITLTLMILLIVLLYAGQIIFYTVALIRRISRYRSRLKDVFASTEGRELHWISWMIALLVLTVLIVIPDMFLGFPEPIRFIPSAFDVGLFLFLAVWGLRQMPGFVLSGESVLPELEGRSNLPRDTENAQTKYEKSGLTDADLKRIAEKISSAMQADKLYLDPDLSLGILSNHIGVSANYVSQTLNGHIGESFFDYINRQRIEHAKPLLTDTKETVLNITYDIGFNSRSSFYKAFKKETGQTPTAFRAAAQPKSIELETA